MKPILFAENATTFTTNGIGRLSSAISCECVEERNGQYEVELTYPIDGQHYSDIGIRKIIVVIPSDGATLQAFRIYKISKPINGKVVINARHISYDLSKNTCMPFSVSSAPTACASTLAGLKTNAVETCPFSFWTDVTTAGSYAQTVPGSIKSRLGGVEGSVLDQFGGEFEWDNWTVKLHNQRGRIATTTGLSLRYGKNITDITQEENIAETVTGVVPYWIDYEGDIVTLTEKVVRSSTASRYSSNLTIPLDLSSKFENKPTEAQLRAAAQVVVNAAGFGLPKVSVEVSFIALWQTEEYKEIAPLERVKLCDEVKVYFEKLGVDVTAKVVKTTYDVLAERYKSIQIGSVRSNLATTITDQEAANLKAIAAQAVSTETAINNATKWLTSAGGYVIAIKNQDGSWKELAFSNMTDPYNANAKVLRINNNGLGFSTTGLNGIFTNAWTIDGNLIADFIHGGTLTLGGNNNGNGWLKIVGADGSTVIGTWDNGGINVKSGSLTLGGKNGRDDANAGVYVGSDGIGLGANSPFKVTNAGALTATGVDITGVIKATSGEIGSGNSKFTITGNHIANGKGSLIDSNNGVYVGTDGIALGQNSKFKVDNQGALNASNASINGTIVSAANNYSVTIQNGKIHCDTPNASSNDSIKITSGSYDELSIGINDFYIEYEEDGEQHHEDVSWHDIYSLVSNYREHGGWW